MRGEHWAAQKWARLFSARSTSESDWTEAELKDVWKHQLNATLELNADDRGPKTEAGGRKSDSIRTFGELFRHPEPPVALLVAVKDFAKEHLAAANKSLLPPDVARGLYYASIAAALVRRNTMITRLALEALHDGLRWCLGQPWLDAETAELLREGVGRKTESGGRK